MYTHHTHIHMNYTLISLLLLQDRIYFMLNCISLSSSGWPWTPGNPPTSIWKLLRLQVCPTTSCYFSPFSSFRWPTSLSKCSKILSEQSFIFLLPPRAPHFPRPKIFSLPFSSHSSFSLCFSSLIHGPFFLFPPLSSFIQEDLLTGKQGAVV